MSQLPLRVRIEYFDQNEAFAAFLPRVGIVEREFRDAKGEATWRLVRLEEPFEYQIADPASSSYRLAFIDAFLVRPRWEGGAVGGEDVSVFVLLVERDGHPRGETVDPRQFSFVAWGMCRRVP